MQLSDAEEKSLIIKTIVTTINESSVPGMFWGQLKRLINQGFTYHQIRIGLEMMIAVDGLNKRSGLKHVPNYIGRALELENQSKTNGVKEYDKKMVKIPLKIDYKYKNNRLKRLE